MQEIWKDIKNYEGLYQISNLGNVRSLDRKVNSIYGYRNIKGKILKPLETNSGYYRVDLKKEQKNNYVLIHRLVAETFIPNPNNLPNINHKDNNPKNNSITNLEWCTQSYNIKYSYKYGNSKPTRGCFKKGNKPHNLKSINQLTLDGKFIKNFSSIKEAALSTKILRTSINNCLRNFSKTAGGFKWEYANK